MKIVRQFRKKGDGDLKVFSTYGLKSMSQEKEFSKWTKIFNLK